MGSAGKMGLRRIENTGTVLKGLIDGVDFAAAKSFVERLRLRWKKYEPEVVGQATSREVETRFKFS